MASQAAAGKIIISEQALKETDIDRSKLEPRSFSALKGISQLVNVWVMHDP